MSLNKLRIQEDFRDFQAVLMPQIGEENCIPLILIVYHIETYLCTNVLLDENKLKKLGCSYLLEEIEEVIKILKDELKYTQHLE